MPRPRDRLERMTQPGPRGLPLMSACHASPAMPSWSSAKLMEQESTASGFGAPGFLEMVYEPGLEAGGIPGKAQRVQAASG